MVFSNGVVMVASLVIVLLACTSVDQKQQEEMVLPAGDPQKPDVIFVSIDSLRADHLSSYGYARKTSPFIDELAAQGVRFHWARSTSPWTLPSHLTMFSGFMSTSHHVVDDTARLDPRIPVLPELMKSSGWLTGGFVSSLYVSEVFGFDRGFDRFEDFDLHTEKKNLSREVNAELVVDTAAKWVAEQQPGKPVFLFLHFYDVHYNYLPPAPYDSMFDRPHRKGDLRYRNYFYFLKKKNKVSKKQFAHQVAQYDESIRYLDDQLRILNDAFVAAGRQVRWVITSDHGEEFGERGSWGHAHTLYAEQLRIPLIFSGQGLPQQTVDQGWVGSHDIAPTILSWAGQKLVADGIDLSPFFLGKTLPERPFLAETSRFKTNKISLLEGEYRLEWNLKNDYAELFQPVLDPKEENNLAAEKPDIVSQLKSGVEALLGDSWEAQEDGFLLLKNGIGLHDGRKKSPFSISKGDRFQLLPFDMTFRFRSNDGVNLSGTLSSIQLDRLSEGSPVKYLGRNSTKKVDLSEENKRLLEKMGYIHTEE